MPVKLNPEDTPAYLKAFRKLIACRDAQHDPEEKSTLDTAAQMMRETWAVWKGEDTLHETAFGDPEE